MAKISNKPSIRFKGFTDAWEQRKLGEYFTERNERSGEGELISVTINAGIKKFNELGRFDTKPEDLSKYKRVEVGDIAYNSMRMWQGASGYSPYSGILSPAYTVISPKTGVSSLFFAYLIKRPQMVHLFEINSQGLTSDTWNLKFPAFSKIEASAPLDIDEQENISELFTVLDNLITLHQRKYEKFVNIKKALLEKMFPQGDEKVPRIRFRGFTDAWEQRKVTELGKIYIGLVTTMTKHYTNEGTLLIRNSDIKDSGFEFGDNPIYLENSFAQENKSRMHQIGDVITVHTGDVGTSAVITENEAKSIGFATIVTRPDPQIIDPNYLCTFLNTDKHKKWAVAISTGDGRTNYNLGDYYELVVPVPSIREQQKISAFIQSLNNLITLHQRQVEKLKNIKSALLEKMFV